MSKPTPPEVYLAWHRAAIARGTEKLAIDNSPECGWYKRKLVKGGPYVPCRIYLRQEVDEAGDLIDDEVMMCEVNGEERDPNDQWGWLAGNPITEARYNYMIDLQAYARTHDTSLPDAHPHRPVDWLNMPMPEFKKSASRK